MLSEVYIFGAGTNGEQCLLNCRRHGIAVRAFLDNYTDKVLFDSVPVLWPETADRAVPVVVTSPNFCVDITLQLEWLGFSVMNLSRFYAGLHLEPDWAGDLYAHLPEYAVTRALLADGRSRTVFDACVKFRRTLDSSWLAAVRSDGKDQWFDPEFFTPGPHVLVDGGAYDGDTAAEFIRRCPEYRKAYLFEPSKALADKAKIRLGGFRDVYVAQAGLSDMDGFARLTNSGLPSGSVGPGGEDIRLKALDKMAIDPPTIIKLDVEGSEVPALQGAQGLIREHKPLLAVALYHRPQDLWEVPKVITGIRQDYKFYLRHYTQFYHETVLYAV